MMGQFARYERYKPSGVEWLGDIPEHWDLQPIRTIFQERKEKNTGPKTDFILSVMKDRGIIPYDEKGNVGNKKSENIENYKVVYPGDLVINKMNAIIGSLGISPYHGALSQVYFVLYPRNKKITDFSFFGYFFQIKSFQKSLIKIARGIMELRESIEFNEFKKLPLTLPPIEEQKRIVKFLDRTTSDIDRAIAQKQRLIELLEEQKTILINQAVTKGLDPNVPMKDSGIEWIGAIPQHWEVKRLKNFSKFITSGPRGWAEHYSDEGSFFLQSGNLNNFMGIELDKANRITPPKSAEAKRTALQDQDILICATGANTGRVALTEINEEEVFINQHLCLVRPKNTINVKFLAFLLYSNIGKTYFKMCQYGLKQGLGFEDINNAIIVEPKPKEQHKIVDFIESNLSTFTEVKSRLVQQIKTLQELKQILISEAVTGKIKV